ncbi:alternative ribosome rescue factor ArfA [Cardiobacterium hominis]|uniref:alternative ribosome rescue factor ArfA n=1 Tax=Cardiobacterium hominis TaxID=2718 RepID=UPI00391F767E
MNRRSLHQDLLHSGKYRQQVVKAKKGKGAFSRHDKHKKHRHDESGGVFFYGRSCRSAQPCTQISRVSRMAARTMTPILSSRQRPQISLTRV